MPIKYTNKINKFLLINFIGIVRIFLLSNAILYNLINIVNETRSEHYVRRRRLSLNLIFF